MKGARVGSENAAFRFRWVDSDEKSPMRFRCRRRKTGTLTEDDGVRPCFLYFGTGHEASLSHKTPAVNIKQGLTPALGLTPPLLGVNLGLSLPFIADSFQQGKDAQGYFRVATGILVPVALRNAAIARLARGTQAAVAARFSALWNSVKLRVNSYGFEPGITGSYVTQRISLSSNVKPGRYLYVVDNEGQMWLGPIEAQVAGMEIKHSSLIPDGAQVRAAGLVVIKSNKAVNLNSDSGHFMQDNPILPAEEPAWFTANVQTLLEAGLAPGEISPHSGLVPD